MKHKVLCLLYYYKHLDEKDLKNLLCMNLIIHKVWIAKETKSTSKLIQKRWSAHSEWWLQKIIQNDIKENIYELTELINECLSHWNVRVMIVDKVADSTLKNESRITFNYFRVTKDLSDTFMKLNSKIHDNLTDSRHKCLMTVNLKHAYLTIDMHSKNKYYFAFIISEIDQLQSIRMQQEFQFIKFIMTKAVYWVFKILSSSMKKFSLLHFKSSNTLSSLTFYINDFFEKFENFEKQYQFLQHHFLSRIEWAKLKLSFKKLKLFEKSIKALEIIHTIDEFIQVLKDKIEKIVAWEALRDQTEVRFFLEVVSFIRRWVKNFAKLAKSLSCLTDKISWKWESIKQLSFDILQIKCAIKISMHEMNLKLFIHFYIDVLNWATSLVITQFQNVTLVNLSKSNSLMKIFIIYDSFSWSLSQWNYLTYKKKLCVIVIFIKKYDYLCKHLYLSTVIHMNHKSLMHFLETDAHENVYDSWVNKLQRLNVTIKYISEARNKVINNLSRILFETNCNEDVRSTMIAK